MSYNLTEAQKDLGRWIVQEIRAQNLPEEFIVVWLDDEGTVIETRDLFEEAMVDSDDDQVFRLVSYDGSYKGVKALELISE